LEDLTPKSFPENNSGSFGVEPLFDSVSSLNQTLTTSGLGLTTTEINPQPLPLTTLSSTSTVFGTAIAQSTPELIAPLSASDSLLSVPQAVNREAASFAFSVEDTSWLGTPRITQLDNLGEVLFVPGDSLETVAIAAQWTFREAEYNNEVGVFVVDELGRVDGIAPDNEGFAKAALGSSSRQVLFNSGNSAGNWRELTFAGGSYLAFYLIQNDTSANWLANNASNTIGQQSLAFFSLQGANPDGFDHSQSTHLGNGIWRINWEDLTGGGDQDFNDVVFNVGQPGILLPGQEEQTVPLTIDLVSNEAIYQNEMGYFLVDTPDGKIADLLPGDEGYADAVLASDRHQVVMTAGETVPTQTVNLPSGKYLGWYLVANGTTADIIQARQNNTQTAPHIFFSYSAANKDGLSHLHAQADSQTWAWEDIWGGGDRDFNDLVFRFDLGDPIGEPTVLPSLSISNLTVTEGDTGTQDANFTVRSSEASTQAVTVEFATEDDTAKAGEDYEAQTGIVNFAAGELEKTISVKVNGDRLQELTENFKVNLINANNNALISQGTGVGTILDDDPLPTNLPPTLSLENSVAAIAENTETSNRRQVADIVITDDGLGNNQIFLSGNDADFFEIENDKLYLKAGTTLDSETKAEYSVTVAVDDAEVGETPDGSVVYTLTIVSSDPDFVFLSAVLANDTGDNGTDGITFDPTVMGQVQNAATLEASLNQGDFIDITDAVNEDGSFTVSFDEYEVLSGGNFPSGDYALVLKARNNLEEKTTTVTFTFDLTPPPLTLELAPVSDTGAIGDNITTEYQVDLTGNTEPGLEVILVETQQTVVADEDGNFTFTDVKMPTVGEVAFNAVVVDEVGNQNRARESVTREGVNTAPEITSTPNTVWTIDVDSTYVYQVEAEDIDGDDLNYILLDAPTDAEIDENGLISFTPEGIFESSYEFTVQVDDGRGGADTQTFTVDIFSENLGTIKGIKWEDLNKNGVRDSDLVQGANPDVVYSSPKPFVNIDPLWARVSSLSPTRII
jgi:hypothetical protein